MKERVLSGRASPWGSREEVYRTRGPGEGEGEDQTVP